MNKHELHQRLMATYLDELQEHVSVFNRDLLALEKSPPAGEREQLLKTLFRSAHSLKGASRAVAVQVVEQACHLLEDILEAVAQETSELTPELVALLFRTADGIEEAGMRWREEQDLASAPLNALLPMLEAAASGARPSAAAAGDRTALSDSEGRVGEAVSPGGEPWEPAAAVLRRLAPAASTVRVAAEKLDELLAHNGELLVARRRVEARAEDMDGLREAFSDWKAEWRSFEGSLRELARPQGLSSQSPRGQLVAARRFEALVDRGRERFTELQQRLERLSTEMRADHRLLGNVCNALDDQVHRVRMLPFAEACGGLQRAVRDLAQRAGKQVDLEILGQDVEVDRSVLEGLKDPLLHLVRNAVDHGIEPAEARRAAGKPPQARITVAAALRGGQVEVVVADDGRGLNLESVRQKLRAKGLAEPHNNRELAQAIFLPGFSTAPIVTDVSGRGVGLDVVRSQVESLHGAVDVWFQAGAGTRFTMAVPLTLTTIRSVLLQAADQIFAVPTASVDQIVRFQRTEVASLGGRDVLRLGGTPIPVAPLASVLRIAQPPGPAVEKQLAIVLSTSQQQAALTVEAVLAEQEITVKSLGARIQRVRHVSGATLLPSGRIALVLNVANLVRTALTTTAVPLPGPIKSAEPAAKRRLLIVDDSMTTRTLLKSILETAGYEVTVAADGLQARQLLDEGHFDLVVSDVDMPHLDGFALTKLIRQSRTHARLPVVLVTARGSDQDRTRGIEVGADAYIVKSGFDQKNLLETIEMML